MRTAAAMREMGKEVLEITEPGWRVSKDSVEKVVEKIGKEVDSTWIVVLQLLDNCVYFAEDDDGERHLPRKGADGKYHVEGALKLATASQASKTMMRAMPILRAMPENKKVLMAPQCRYLRPCCDDQDHCTNCKEESYRRKMLDGIKI
jgi:hypothetical protein